MEEWDYVDEHQLQGWKGREICITCQHFTYGIDQHCRTLVAYNLRRGLLQQGEHLLKRCEHWAWVSAEAPPAEWLGLHSGNFSDYTSLKTIGTTGI